MIIRRDGDELVLTRQMDHAAVSGELACHWGNAFFSRPVPRDQVVYACGMHDEAWRDLDEHPRVEPENGWPASFLQMPLDVLFAAYLDGAERVARAFPYSGFLVIMHYQGFFNGRFGLTGSLLTREENDTSARQIEAYFRACESLRARFRGLAAKSGHVVGSLTSPDVAHAYLMLQVVDAISLFLCLNPAQEWPLGVARRTPLCQAEEFIMKPVDAARALIDPWPFDIEQLNLTFPVRRIPARRYSTAQELRETLQVSPWQTTSIQVSPNSSR